MSLVPYGSLGETSPTTLAASISAALGAVAFSYMLQYAIGKTLVAAVCEVVFFVTEMVWRLLVDRGKQRTADACTQTSEGGCAAGSEVFVSSTNARSRAHLFRDCYHIGHAGQTIVTHQICVHCSGRARAARAP